jgi:hypothetical protein
VKNLHVDEKIPPANSSIRGCLIWQAKYGLVEAVSSPQPLQMMRGGGDDDDDGGAGKLFGIASSFLNLGRAALAPCTLQIGQ